MSEVEQGPSEDDFFNDAVSDEAPEVPVVAEAKVEPVEEKQPEKEPEPVVSEGEKPPIPPKPEWRLKEDAEARRAAESALADERAEKAALKQRLEALERANKPEPKADVTVEPDPLLDPKGYREFIQNQVKNDLLNDRREESLIRAREANQTEFDEAYAAAGKAVDPALKARMQNSRDPGKTLLEWHRENKVKAEVGSDPNAWLEKKLEERLKDPAFLAKAVELARGSAQPQTNGKPNVELPPSLSGVSRASAAVRSNDDLSDEQLFAEATG